MNTPKLLQKELVYFVLALVLVLVACQTSTDTGNDEIIVTIDHNTATTTPEAITYVIEQVPVFYTSVPELASKSDVILIGKIISTGEIINMARDVDTTKPDPNYFGIGQIYEIKVEQYLKGNGEKSIQVIQYQGFIVTGTGDPTVVEIEKTKAETDYIELRSDQRVLMFLDKSPYEYSEYPDSPLFISAGQPWLFDAMDTKCVYPLSMINEIFKHFHPQPLDAVLEKIGEPYNASEKSNTSPYPPPEKIYNCSNENKDTKPYP